MHSDSNIPAANVYYLLCYAWEWLEGRELVGTDAVRGDRIQDILGMALAEGTSRLLRRGLDRSYLERHEEGRSPRGKLDLPRMATRVMSERGLVAYATDELSADVLHNQLIAATLSRLAGSDVSPQLSSRLRLLLRRFPQQKPVTPTHALFRRVHLHRHNAVYRFLLSLCELLLECLLPEPGAGGYRFHDFRAAQSEMGLLFQTFVRRFLEAEQRVFKVTTDTVMWDATAEGSEHLRHLPRMLTDITLTRPDRRVVIEVKYTESIFQSAWGGSPKLRSDHLYQLLSYLKNLECRGGANAEATGVLLYATSGINLDLRYRVAGHPVRVRTIDLARSWGTIRDDLLSLVGDLAA